MEQWKRSVLDAHLAGVYCPVDQYKYTYAAKIIFKPVDQKYRGNSAIIVFSRMRLNHEIVLRWQTRERRSHAVLQIFF